MKTRFYQIFFVFFFLIFALFILFGIFAFSFRRPYRKTVYENCSRPALAFSVIKAESGFREKTVSDAGAVGLMQIMPKTAEFICKRKKIPFDAERLTDGNYNVMLGCNYLEYLINRFQSVQETALAAYNAGEGIVAIWLSDRNFSDDGLHLKYIPYPETREYVKKVLKYQKIYAIFD